MHLRDWLDGVAAGGDDSPASCWNVDAKIINNEYKITLPNLTLSAPCVPQAGTVGIGFDRVISTNGVATAVDGRRWPQRLQNRASAM